MALSQRIHDFLGTPSPWVVGAVGVASVSALLVALSSWLFAPAKGHKQIHHSGNFLPVSKEVSQGKLYIKEGELPKEIDGMFIRNGPNPLYPDDNLNYHWFEGWGMLHGVTIQNGIASYRNQFTSTPSFEIEKNYGSLYYYPFFAIKGVVGLLSLMWQKFRGKLGLVDRYRKETANTASIFHAGKFLALMEAQAPYWVVADQLKTKGRYTFDDTLTHSFTAHPKVDPRTQEMIFFGYNMETKPYIHYSVVDKSGKKGPSVGINLERPIMMHDFAITENYSIFMDLPLIFNKKNIFDKSKAGFFEFNSKSYARLGVLPRNSRDGSEMKWFKIRTCYCFHTANAWEDGDCIELYLSRYEDFDLYAIDEAFNIPKMYRYRLNLKTNEVEENEVSPIPIEFPVINEDYMGVRSRFIYGASLKADQFAVVKFDIDTNETTTYHFAGKDMGGEFVFIPHPTAKTEDDGWLIGFRYIQAKDASEVVILKANDMTVQAVLELPQRVPQGFHGRWLTRQMLNSQTA